MAQAMGRRIATIRPEPVAAALYTPMRILGTVTLPLIWPWYVISDRLLGTVFRVRAEEHFSTNEEDLRVLVDAVEETEALEEDEREMITSIFELSDRDVREIMVPRPDIVGADGALRVTQVIDLLVSTGHSRVPVYEGDIDHISGLVHLRDLAEALRKGRGDTPISTFVRPLHVVPETKKIDELLHDFQGEHIQMAVVADEYGGTAGLVTIEDLIEEIVGEIHDEYDVVEEWIKLLSANEAVVDARVSIHDFNEALNLELDDTEYDTIGGLIYDQLGKVPTVGDVVDTDAVSFRVLTTKGRRVQRVQVNVHRR
jgi:CBS domain containing-hemolysin-like protein